MSRIIGIFLCVLIIFSAISVSFAAEIGNTSYGYVTKEYYGNQSSNDTIVLIIGVHPQENGIHTGTLNAVKNKSSILSKKYVIYAVHVTQDADDYSKGRMNGQLLAQKFIVPDVSSENPILVMDTHENHYKDSGYEYARFLYPISKNALTTKYVKEIIAKMPFLVSYAPPNPSSTQYVTVPIANKGINTIIYETYRYDSTTKKASDASNLIDALDSPAISEPAVMANPAGGLYNVSKNVVLTAKSGNIYYTTNGSTPTNNSTLYTGPIKISSTITLKFISIGEDGKQSPVFTEKYVIDKVSPKVVSITPKNGAIKVSRTSTISIKFTENIKNSTNWSKIYIKNLRTGKIVGITKSISGNILNIKMTAKRSSYTTYQVYIPASALKDMAGNNFSKAYTFKFRTGRY